MAVEEAARVVQVAIVRERATVKFYVAVRSLNIHMGEFLATLDESTRQLQAGELDGVVDHASESVDPLEIVNRLEKAYRFVNGMYVLATFAGLRRRRLTKGEVIKLGDIAERLLDYVVWLRDAATPEAQAFAADSYAEGMRELEAGDTVAFV